MNTIDYAMLGDVGITVEAMELHIVSSGTVELNGATGGVDITVRGFDSNDVSLYNERTIKVAL